MSRPPNEGNTTISSLFSAAQVWLDARRSAKYPKSIFIWIPKNAGTSVYNMLRKNGLVKLNTRPAIQRYFRAAGRVTFGHMKIGSLLEAGLVPRDFVDEAFKFAIVRDPYARAVSLHRFLSGLPPLFPTHATSLRNWHVQPSFREFLQLIDDGFYDRIGLYNSRGMSLCNPQVEWLRDTPPDKIYKVEELSAFVEGISERWAIAKPNILHLNQSGPVEQPQLSREEKALIEKVYAEDFEVLGYDSR